MTIDKEIIGYRRHIHKNPELSGCEFETAKFIESKLKELNIPFKRINKTGVCAVLSGGKKGKTIALRADMDALPVLEENTVEYKSVNPGVMHACGHDSHVAVLLGAAALLSKEKADLKGNIKFIFQPAEETADGAKGMIKGGALKNPKPDMILGLHVCPWIKSGKIGIKYGEMMAAVDKFEIEIKGKLAHGAYPELGKDAIVAAANFINSVQTIVAREISPLDSAVITIGKISGGTAYNIICDKVKLIGTVRTFNNSVRQTVKKSILNKLKGLETAFGVKCKADYKFIDEPLINTKSATDFCFTAAKEFYGEKNVEIVEKPSMGGEDFANYLEHVPGNFMYVGVSKDKKTSNSWHSNNFNIDETALPKAAQFVAFVVKKFLS